MPKLFMFDGNKFRQFQYGMLEKSNPFTFMLFSGGKQIAASLPMAGCCQNSPKVGSIFMTKPLNKLCVF